MNISLQLFILRLYSSKKVQSKYCFKVFWKAISVEFPLWCSGLRIWHCLCSGLGHCWGVGLNPDPGTSICCERSRTSAPPATAPPAPKRKAKLFLYGVLPTIYKDSIFMCCLQILGIIFLWTLFLICKIFSWCLIQCWS